MKTLCPKPGKGGKIHPSPSEDPIRAAFRLLPAAILVLVAGLGQEDREVLAYLVTLPVELAKEAAAGVPLPEQPPARGGRSGRRRGGYTTPAVWFVGHPPTHGCGCFECYISFWARWNRSPERDRIHEAIEAFEDHLAAAVSSATPPSSSRRRAGRSRVQAASPPPPPPPPLPMPLRRTKPPASQVIEVVQAPASPLPPSSPPPLPSQAPVASTADAVEEVVPEPAATVEPEECREVAAEVAEEERKRGWADVMGGVLGLRLWGIWSPAVESAT